MPIKLFKTHSLTFTRYPALADEDQYDINGKFLGRADPTPIPNVKGSLQPWRRAITRDELPEGVTAKDLRMFMTQTELLSANEFTNQPADETEIDSVPYIVHHVEPWVGYGLKSDHYRVFLLRKDKLNGNES